jgi:hypothetical protein
MKNPRKRGPFPYTTSMLNVNQMIINAAAHLIRYQINPIICLNIEFTPFVCMYDCNRHIINRCTVTYGRAYLARRGA